MELINGQYEIAGHNVESLAEEYGTPLWAYDMETMERCIGDLKDKIGVYPDTEFLYAIKANFNPHIVQFIVEQGFGIDAVSIDEVEWAIKCGVPVDRIMYTENMMSDEEMRRAQELGVLINAGSLSRLEEIGKAKPGSDVCVRIKPDVGDGIHAKLITGTKDSKFGIPHQYIDQIKAIAQKYGLNIIGIHAHVGSGWLKTGAPLAAMEIVLKSAREFPGLLFIDLGGGFGVPYQPDDQPLDMVMLGEEYAARMEAFVQEYHRRVKLMFEPGRYVVAEAGHLLVGTTTIKRNPDGRLFVGTDSGMHHLIRPALYGSHHPITNISNPHGGLREYDVTGNVCESSDFFGKGRKLSEVRKGHKLAIGMAGAYGASMSSEYQCRPQAREVALYRGRAAQLIAESPSLDERFARFQAGLRQ